MTTQAIAIKQKAADRFSQWSGRYDKSLLQNLVFRYSHDMFIREIAPISKNRVSLLDVGCGTGEFVFRAIGQSFRIQARGVDISADMIRMARSKLRSDSVEFKVGDVEDLPYDDDTFDVITCSHSFHHYPNQKKALKEMHRVLRDNGRVMIVDGCRDRLLGNVIFGKIIKRIERDVHHAMAGEMRELCRSAGFDSIAQKIFNSFIPLLFTLGIKKKR